MPTSAFTLYLRKIGNVSLLCDYVTLELARLLKELPSLEASGIDATKPYAIFDRDSVSLRGFEEKARHFLDSFWRLWKPDLAETVRRGVGLAKGPMPKADGPNVLIEEFFSYTNDLAEVIDDIKAQNPQALTLAETLESRVSRLNLLAIALIETRNAYSAGREAALSRTKRPISR